MICDRDPIPLLTSLVAAVELRKRRHPDRMPGDIISLGVGVDDILDFTVELTQDVVAAVPKAAESSIEILRRWKVELR